MVTPLKIWRSGVFVLDIELIHTTYEPFSVKFSKSGYIMYFRPKDNHWEYKTSARESWNHYYASNVTLTAKDIFLPSHEEPLEEYL